MEKTTETSANHHHSGVGKQNHTQQHKQSPSWVAINNNNNTFLESSSNNIHGKNEITTKVGVEQQEDIILNAQQKNWKCDSCNESGGVVVGDSKIISCSNDEQHRGGADELMQNGCIASLSNSRCNNSNPTTISTPACLQTNHPTVMQTITTTNATNDGEDDDCCAGAASLTQLGAGVVELACGIGDANSLHSNHTSTENLSYSSDNYYPDDLILLDDDDDPEAEEISLNSDDCVYAYRGDGTEFDLTLDALTGRRLGVGNANLGPGGNAGVAGMDDEPDFLEMDFEPDPLSEVEYGDSVLMGPTHTDAYLMQRDTSQLSGRHSANLHTNTSTPSTTGRQLFSSPIDDLPAPKALQAQSMLSKNFARITLHLDQIKGAENGIDCDIYHRGVSAMSSSSGGCCTLGSGNSKHANDLTDFAKQSTAHSLPNTLHTSFGRDVHEKEEIKTSPSKITGAKPKRLSTFSTSSSTSSKNSSKSRSSLRSAFVPPICGSASFDERSVSCTEFRSVEDSSSVVGVPTCAPNPADDFNTNDESCLDCLEKEFLANTIGKTMEHKDCAKCSKRRISSSYYARAEQAATRCRSGSPSFFADLRDDSIFEHSNSDFATPRRVTDWSERAKHVDDLVVNSFSNYKRISAAASIRVIRADDISSNNVNNAGVGSGGHNEGIISDSNSGGGNGVLMFMNDEHKNQRRTTTCDTYNGEGGGDEQLLTNLLRTDEEIVTISILNLNEETLVQALDKLQVSYNLELLKTHFKQNASASATNQLGTHTPPAKDFKSLKHFILHESKKNCNHPKLKRLIELATRQQVQVQFKKNSNVTETEMVALKVTDILHQWTRTKNLELLKQLDKRFINANILGKIANIIRQAQQQRCASRRPLPEFISIPQYYPSGFLTLTKKC